MSKPAVVALYSPTPGCGKTTLAQMIGSALTKETGKPVRAISFATTLKQVTYHLLLSLGLGEKEATDRVYGSRKDEIVPALGVTSRYIQRTLGTEWGRQTIHDEIWVKCWTSQVRAFLEDDCHVVTDDVRFLNELVAAGLVNATTIYVDREGAGKAEHTSDGQLDELQDVFKIKVKNNGSLGDLREIADSLVPSILLRASCG